MVPCSTLDLFLKCRVDEPSEIQWLSHRERQRGRVDAVVSHVHHLVSGGAFADVTRAGIELIRNGGAMRTSVPVLRSASYCPSQRSGVGAESTIVMVNVWTESGSSAGTMSFGCRRGSTTDTSKPDSVSITNCCVVSSRTCWIVAR